MSITRNRILNLEKALGLADVDDAAKRSEVLAEQIVDLSATERHRLDAIIGRVIDIVGPEGPMFLPAGCEHLRDAVAFIDANEDAYFAAVAEEWQSEARRQ